MSPQRYLQQNSYINSPFSRPATTPDSPGTYTASNSLHCNISITTRNSDGRPSIAINTNGTILEEFPTCIYHQQPMANEVGADYQYPNFEPCKAPKDTIDINKTIYDRIQLGPRVPSNVLCNQDNKDLKRKKKPSSKCGWLYILTSSCASGHVKIGKTKKSAEARKKYWRKCNMPLKRVDDPFRDAFEYYGLAESLVALELANKKRKFSCKPCTEIKTKTKAQKAARARAAMQQGSPTANEEIDEDEQHNEEPPYGEVLPSDEKNHIEWYEAEVQTALRSVDIWRSWLVRHKPYDDEGNLTPYWEWQLRRSEERLSSLRWDRWTQPWQIEYCFFKVRYHYRKLKAHWARHDWWFWAISVIAILMAYTWSIIGAIFITVVSLAS